MTRAKKSRAEADRWRLDMFAKAEEILDLKREKDKITERYLHYKAECVKLQDTVVD